MKYNPDSHHRHSIRLPKYDYATTGAYYVTLCAYGRECLFGEIVRGRMRLNDVGWMVENCWNGLPSRFCYMRLDEYVIMPNHIHGIVVITGTCRGEACLRPPSDNRNQGEHKVRPYGTLSNTLGRIIQAFKSLTTNECIRNVKQHNWRPFAEKLWQRNYYEHVIRNEKDLNEKRRYIALNPRLWKHDEENPDGQPINRRAAT